MRHGARTLTRCVTAVSLVIGVAACGGGSGDDAAEETGAGIDAASPEEVAAAKVDASSEVLVARWGGEGAFFVVVWANDLGYRTQQIVDAAESIAADGTIPGVAPEGEPLGMLTELPAGEPQSMAPIAIPVAAAGPADGAGDDTPQNAYIGSYDRTLDEVFTAGQEAVDRAEARDEDEALLELGVIVLVQKLGMQGYSAPQIIEAILLFDREVFKGASSLSSNCLIAIRSGDRWLKPAFPPAQELGCTPAWIADPDGKSIGDDNAATEPTAAESNPPEGAAEPAAADDEGGGESFSGPIDFVGYFEAVDPMIAGKLTITTNEMVVVIEGDQVTSITGTGTISWPEIEAGNNTTICASDTTWAIDAEVPVQPRRRRRLHCVRVLDRRRYQHVQRRRKPQIRCHRRPRPRHDRRDSRLAAAHRSTFASTSKVYQSDSLRS